MYVDPLEKNDFTLYLHIFSAGVFNPFGSRQFSMSQLCAVRHVTAIYRSFVPGHIDCRRTSSWLLFLSFGPFLIVIFLFPSPLSETRSVS